MTPRICPDCGGESGSGARFCGVCGRKFTRNEQTAQPDGEPTARTEEPAPHVEIRRHRSSSRAVVGTLGFIVILISGIERCSTATLTRSASAVQITQIYTEGAFFVLEVVGLVIAFYVAVRPD